MDKFEVPSPSADHLNLTTAAVLSSAALFIASKGKLKEGLVEVIERGAAGFAKQTAKSVGAEAAPAGRGVFMQMTETGAESKSVGSLNGLSEYGLKRRAEDEAKQAAQEAGRQRMQTLSNLDEATKPAAQARMAQFEKDGFPLRSSYTGLPLNRNEHHYAAYMDSLERKSVLEFHEEGTLLPGIYRMNMEQFKAVFTGNPHRQALANNLEEVLRGLTQAGVKEVHIGGSFVTKKVRPNDIDFIFDRTAPGVIPSRLPAEAAYNHCASLRRQGLQLFVDPPGDGSYKGMQYYFSHGKVEYPIRRRGHWITGGGTFPKGLVELSL